MALKKLINLPTGVAGDYIRLEAFRWERGAIVSAHFALYKDKATAQQGGAPLLATAAKLRLYGPAVEQRLGKEPTLAKLYAAAKAVASERRATGRDPQSANLVSDFGRDLLADAVDD